MKLKTLSIMMIIHHLRNAKCGKRLLGSPDIWWGYTKRSLQEDLYEKCYACFKALKRALSGHLNYMWGWSQMRVQGLTFRPLPRIDRQDEHYTLYTIEYIWSSKGKLDWTGMKWSKNSKWSKWKSFIYGKLCVGQLNRGRWSEERPGYQNRSEVKLLYV